MSETTLFCCDAALEPTGEHEDVGSQGFVNEWWVYVCPQCQRRWLWSRQWSAGAGGGWDWLAQRRVGDSWVDMQLLYSYKVRRPAPESLGAPS